MSTSFVTSSRADDDWERLKENVQNGIINLPAIVECINYLNIRDNNKRNTDLNKYISKRDEWSYVIKGKDWRELYYQHFPDGENPSFSDNFIATEVK